MEAWRAQHRLKYYMIIGIRRINCVSLVSKILAVALPSHLRFVLRFVHVVLYIWLSFHIHYTVYIKIYQVHPLPTASSHTE